MVMYGGWARIWKHTRIKEQSWKIQKTTKIGSQYLALRSNALNLFNQCFLIELIVNSYQQHINLLYK